MADLATRFSDNPLLKPADVAPSRPEFRVDCLLNPGVFRYQGKTGLLIRVAETLAATSEEEVTAPIFDIEAEGGIRFLTVRKDDPEADTADPRIFTWRGDDYLTTLSHLRLAWSEDGEHFCVEKQPNLMGLRSDESYGIEDCRVSRIEETYWLTYTAVSACGVGVGCATTRDWQTFERHGLILPPHNKDCALFEERIGGRYFCLHRPSSVEIGGNYIWLADSADGLYWGGHTCLARTRPGRWDSARIGGGAAPIPTEAGWLCIYHGADDRGRYCLGGLLLDRDNPRRVLARSQEPIMEPTADYERKGFFNECVFTNGHVLDGDRLTLYYGAADTVIAGAHLSVTEILATL